MNNLLLFCRQYIGIRNAAHGQNHAGIGNDGRFLKRKLVEARRNLADKSCDFPNHVHSQGVQLQRLLDATKRLDSIPALVEDKKWSQIQGILTGPLGTLTQTLTSIASNASSKSSVTELTAKSKQVKEDIFNINLAASKKNPDAVIANTKAAQTSLEAFVRSAF